MIEEVKFREKKREERESEETKESIFLRGSRPQSLKEFVGQEEIKVSLEVFLSAAKQRNSALDHVLLHGPPGLGKTSLATIISKELGVSVKSTSGVALEKPGDLISVLSSMKGKTVFFIDEIHRLKRPLEEILYTAMEDLYIDVLMGEGTGGKSIRLRLEPFTLIGATTRPGDITQALHSRFGIIYSLSYYEGKDIEKIIDQQLERLGMDGEKRGLEMLSHRCCYTPRNGLRLLRRCIDYAQIYGEKNFISTECVERTLRELQIDELGMDKISIDYLKTICIQFNGGPVGIQSISAAIGSHGSTLEETVEPYMLRIGMIQRTSQGRVALEKAYEHLKIPEKKTRLLLWDAP